MIHRFLNPVRTSGSCLLALAFALLLMPAAGLAQAPPPYTISTAIGTFLEPSGTVPPWHGVFGGW